MQTNDKVKSLLGFAIKAGKIVYGVDNINASRRRKHLIVVCHSLSENAMKQLVRNNSTTEILRVKYALLEDVVFKQNCKVIALMDKQMAQAILDNFNRDKYDLISEGK